MPQRSMLSADESAHREALRNPLRLAALRDLGLSSSADEQLDFFAGCAAELVKVPIGLVSLVTDDQQLFPGMCGLPQPWADQRRTPLSHSFCQYVVGSAEPLVIEDTRSHPLGLDNLAVGDLSVVAYLGVPLTDAAGLVLGSLCAIDTVPRRWTEADVNVVTRIAQACSADLRLRLALHDSDQQRARREALEMAERRMHQRDEMLLAASQAFTGTITLDDVRVQVTELAANGLGASYVGLVLLDDDRRLRRVRDQRLNDSAENSDEWAGYDLDTVIPTATAARESRLVHYSDRAAFDADHPTAVQKLLRDLDLHACVAAPLRGPDGVAGSVVFGWTRPREVDPVELITITTLADYISQALGRADRLAYRVGVAHQMQSAMLTDLPVFPGLRLAARYKPADSRERVGGDWYDAIEAPGDPDGATLLISVGDVVGHELAAVNLMAQTRSMLRQAACDRPGGSPAEIISAFENANACCDVGSNGSAVLARLRPQPDGSWVMSWTNAGHPPPVLLLPDGTPKVLSSHDFLFGYAIDAARHDHQHIISPGSTLMIYSDGLVERRGTTIDDGIAEAVRVLGELRDCPVSDIADMLMARVARDTSDDTVVFLVRFG